MAVKYRDGGGCVKDEAARHSRAVKNDLYTGRTTDADLASSDGQRLEDRDEWNMSKVSRRGAWSRDEAGDD